METWTVIELRKYARKLGISMTGRKAELIERIVRAELSQHVKAA
jgi:hypothetical protein